ncbi:uncharacterized protein LOC119689963 [Teleopsis dalmanni]|uniref:uncharacterized protein LOC119689963 n=1 Tax=Teleopsis dalmanni TaxID=139649 RepID=UPI0018CF939B|nr:uncharacterized protein LOC119689963 [Teleopsis dalmanni]
MLSPLLILIILLHLNYPLLTYDGGLTVGRNHTMTYTEFYIRHNFAIFSLVFVIIYVLKHIAGLRHGIPFLLVLPRYLILLVQWLIRSWRFIVRVSRRRFIAEELQGHQHPVAHRVERGGGDADVLLFMNNNNNNNNNNDDNGFQFWNLVRQH